VTFQKIQQGQTQPLGLCVSNVQFAEGEARISVTFQGEKLISDVDSGRLLLGYRSPHDEYLSVGLVGYGAAYVISRFDPSQGWLPTAIAGSHDNLLPNRTYQLAIRVIGQRIVLEVDSVRVLEHVLAAPLQTGQLGLFTWGNRKIEFGKPTVAQEPGTVFVIMDFSDHYQEIYTEVIHTVINEFPSLQAHHAGEVYGPGIILEDIQRDIVDAKIIVAEITPPNQNVFYELGYAHALGKPTILLAEKDKALPFDISGYRCLFYEDSISGRRKVEEGLRKHLEAILQE